MPSADRARFGHPGEGSEAESSSCGRRIPGDEVAPNGKPSPIRSRGAPWVDERNPQGVPSRTMQKLARYLATNTTGASARRASVRCELHHRDRRADIHFISTFARDMKTRCRSSSRTDGRLGPRAAERSSSRLTDPTAHGGRQPMLSICDSVDAGLRVLRKTHQRGLGPRAHRRAWVLLMKRLGYTGFVAQGGDWGALVTDLMGQAAPECSDPHHMAGTVPPELDQAAFAGAPTPPNSRARRSRRTSSSLLLCKGLSTHRRWDTAPKRVRIADSPSAWPR